MKIMNYILLFINNNSNLIKNKYKIYYPKNKSLIKLIKQKNIKSFIL